MDLPAFPDRNFPVAREEETDAAEDDWAEGRDSHTLQEFAAGRRD
jgi:hypothetical protein